MSQNYSTKKIKCANFLNKHKKICYEPDSVHFKQLQNLAHPLKLLYPDLSLTLWTYLCIGCYEHALELVTSTDNEYSTDVNFIDNGIDRDEDYLPRTAEQVEEFNNKISTFSQDVYRLLRGKILYVKNQLKIT